MGDARPIGGAYPRPFLKPGVDMRKIVLTFGLIAGGILAVGMLITAALNRRIDFDKGLTIGYTTMVAAFLMAYIGVKAYRDNVAGGEISFGRAFVVGILITALASVCYVAMWEVVLHTVWPDFSDKYAAQMVAQARANGATGDQLAEAEKKAAEFKVAYSNPVMVMLYTFAEPVPVGLVLALMAAGVLSRRRKSGSSPSAIPATPAT